MSKIFWPWLIFFLVLFNRNTLHRDTGRNTCMPHVFVYAVIQSVIIMWQQGDAWNHTASGNGKKWSQRVGAWCGCWWFEYYRNCWSRGIFIQRCLEFTQNHVRNKKTCSELAVLWVKCRMMRNVRRDCPAWCEEGENLIGFRTGIWSCFRYRLRWRLEKGSMRFPQLFSPNNHLTVKSLRSHLFLFWCLM